MSDGEIKMSEKITIENEYGMQIGEIELKALYVEGISLDDLLPVGCKYPLWVCFKGHKKRVNNYPELFKAQDWILLKNIEHLDFNNPSRRDSNV